MNGSVSNQVLIKREDKKLLRFLSSAFNYVCWLYYPSKAITLTCTMSVANCVAAVPSSPKAPIVLSTS